MIQVNRIYLIFNRLVTKKFLVDTSGLKPIKNSDPIIKYTHNDRYGIIMWIRKHLLFNLNYFL